MQISYKNRDGQNHDDNDTIITAVENWVAFTGAGLYKLNM